MVLHMLQWRRWLLDGNTTGLGADLDDGAAVLGREEGSAVGNGARRCTAQQRLWGEGVALLGAVGAYGGVWRGLAEGARLRW
jgi:hypothetical protein